MRYILCYQTPYNSVAYITDELMSVDFLPYSDFLSYSSKYIKQNIEGYVSNLNRFYNILINIENGTWELYKKEFKVPTMEQLVKLNEKKQSKNRFWRKKEKTKIDKIKNYTDNIIDKKYNLQKPFQQQFYNDIKKKDFKNLKVIE